MYKGLGWLLIYIFCFSHLTQLAVDYLKFETVTEVLLGIESKLEYPRIALCISSGDPSSKPIAPNHIFLNIWFINKTSGQQYIPTRNIQTKRVDIKGRGCFSPQIPNQGFEVDERGILFDYNAVILKLNETLKGNWLHIFLYRT